MSIRPIKTWSYPGALLDALVDTRRAVADVSMPIPLENSGEAQGLVTQTLDQLDQAFVRTAGAGEELVVGRRTVRDVVGAKREIERGRGQLQAGETLAQ